MRVAITGHTKGIGLALSKVFPDYIGFSRSNGYDITNSESRQRIILESEECDVFFNNASADFGQFHLLNELWVRWREKNRTIVNMGSRASDFVHNAAYPNYSYAVQKNALEDASKYMTHTFKPCKIVCIKPGYVDTSAVAHISGKKIDPMDLAVYIKQLLELDKTFWIPVVTLYPR